MKARLKSVFLRLGVWEPLHRVWVKRPDVRTMLYNCGYRLAGAQDGLPIPPTRLIRLVQINGEISVYLRGGLLARHSIEHALIHHGIKPSSFKRVLDFGCGCGRVLRYWRDLNETQLFGVDINPLLIQWCRSKLSSLAEFRTNQLLPPLDYPDEFFDFIYAISVFTHLSEHAQILWLQELKRVLVKGGLLLFTVHGIWRASDLSPEDQARFFNDELVVVCEDEEGSNVCGAYHPEGYVRTHLAKGFEVLDFIPGGAIDVGQDIYIFRKGGL